MNGSSLAALGWGKTPEPPYYVAIFTSQLSGDVEGFAETAERLVERVHEQPGFLAMDSAEGHNGVGIVIAYWKDEASIQKWKQKLEHVEAQKLGRTRWLKNYQVRIARVERAYGFERS